MNKYLVYCWNAVKGFWPWYKSLYLNKKWYNKAGLAFASLIVAFLLYLFLVDINFLWLFGRSPSLSSIRNPKTVQASELYSADGVLIGKYFS
jgi:penicillin-binding protein 1A